MNTWNGMELEQAHRELWNWLAENPGMDKKDFLALHNEEPSESPMSLCFACEACEGKCDRCPLGEGNVGCTRGRYDLWRTLTRAYGQVDSVTKRKLKNHISKVAVGIANLTWINPDEIEIKEIVVADEEFSQMNNRGRRFIVCEDQNFEVSDTVRLISGTNTVTKVIKHVLREGTECGLADGWCVIGW